MRIGGGPRARVRWWPQITNAAASLCAGAAPAGRAAARIGAYRTTSPTSTPSAAAASRPIRTPADSWYDYQHRYTAGLSEHVIPAPLPTEVYRQVQETAVAAH